MQEFNYEREVLLFGGKTFQENRNTGTFPQQLDTNFTFCRSIVACCNLTLYNAKKIINDNTITSPSYTVSLVTCDSYAIVTARYRYDLMSKHNTPQDCHMVTQHSAIKIISMLIWIHRYQVHKVTFSQSKNLNIVLRILIVTLLPSNIEDL